MIRFFATCCALFLLISMGPAGLAQTRKPTGAGETEVTLAIYSGVADPVWVLTRAETAEFRMRLQQLPRAQGAFGRPERLGYLRVEMPGHGRARQEVTIDHGRVVWQDYKVLHFLTDPGRALESWLLKTGENRTPHKGGWIMLKDLDPPREDQHLQTRRHR